MRRVALVVAVVSLAVLAPGGSIAGPSFDRARSSRSFVLPIPADQTWYVCQGYNAEITHEDVPALDLSLDSRSAGPQGCMGGSRYTSAGSEVTSPAAGTAYRWPGCCGHDFVCVNFDTGGSAAIGHLDNRVASGTRVGTASRIGTVAWPAPANGDYAHVHVQVHPDPDCTEESDPVPFDEAHGFRWECTPNLPASGAVNEYSGLAVDRCKSSDAGPRDEPGDATSGNRRNRDDDPETVVSGPKRSPELATMVELSIRSAGRVTLLAGRSLSAAR